MAKQNVFTKKKNNNKNKKNASQEILNIKVQTKHNVI